MLAFFLAIVVQRTIHLRLHERVQPLRLAPKRDGVSRILAMSLFAAQNIWVFFVLDRALPRMSVLPRWPLPALDHLGVRILGAVLTAFAFAIFGRAMRDLGPSWRLGVDEETPGQLVTSGIYAASRHPIYLFFNLYHVGTWLIQADLLFLALALLIGVGLHYERLLEERFLVRLYGEVYLAYCRRVPRYGDLGSLLRVLGRWILGRMQYRVKRWSGEVMKE